MNRPWLVWPLFAVCLAAVVAALSWISVTALRLDKAEATTRAQAEIEEDVRLALWRMDSYLGNLVAEETVRPYFTYSAFYPAGRGYARLYNGDNRLPDEFLIPSPLLTDAPPHVRLYFQIDGRGRFSSPQAPDKKMQRLVDPKQVKAEAVARSAALLADLQASLSKDRLAAVVPRDLSPPREGTLLADVQRQQAEIFSNQVRRQSPVAQQVLNTAEFQARQNNFNQLAANQYGGSAIKPGDVRAGVMKPVWIDDHLFLARWVAVGNDDFLQGVWLDWPSLGQTLLANVRDLFPQRSCCRYTRVNSANPQRTLAVLPLEFAPGARPVVLGDAWSPIRVSLMVVWVCVLLATLAFGLLLLGVVRLSDRRATFVSAVTHELRTPLTTFRMYSEMLSEDMVPEPKRRQYLSTLRVEADRLGRLVENVLAYARLERARPSNRLESLRLDDLLRQIEPRARRRVSEANMELDIAVADDAAEACVQADPSVVEQIVFNLVDNACKYAVDANPARLHLELSERDGQVCLCVRDHGPGVSRREARRLFRPFSKSARDAAHSAPGVGLGLALSRRLARSMGGDLQLKRDTPGGAVFELTLRMANN